MTESKANGLLIDYYKNREALRLIKVNISEATSMKDIDLSEFRYEWFGVDGGEGWCEAYNAEWKGWVAAVSSSQAGYKPEEMALAKLLDEKKRIIVECGYIKRRIYLAGKSLNLPKPKAIKEE